MKTLTSALVVLLFFMIGLAFGRDLELKKRIGEYNVKISLDRNPPIIGKNPIEIQIKDSRGQAVTATGVLINYYMPPMPRMAPMNYIIPAEANRTSYRATMDFIMSGPWVIAVKITSAGKTRTAKFHIDVP
ncbi:MAG: FixH family protein [Proteobacteria bacterium]|nr:FixH family protein [Pseudomonadota bacterium]